MQVITTKKIVLDTATHKGRYVVLIKFPYDNELADLVRKLPNAKWSKSNRAWTMPYNVEVLYELKKLFAPVCEIDATLLKQKVTSYINDPKNNVLDAKVLDKLEKYKQWLQSKRYSASTIGTYTEALKVFFKFFYDKNLSDITNEDIIKFNNEYVLKNKFSASYQNQVVNAIKLFFRTMEHKAIHVDSIDRPKKGFKLPVILSLEEVAKMLNSMENIKHRTMLALIYSAGLRRSELLNMKIKDVDSKRMLI